MARIRPARGQDRSGEGTPTPGGARPPAPTRRTPAKPKQAKAPTSPRPAPQGGNKRKAEKTGTVTKAVAAERRGSRFISEVIAELRKVSWPTRTQLLQSTAVVLVVVAIVAVYLAALDAVFSRMIDAIF